MLSLVFPDAASIFSSLSFSATSIHSYLPLFRVFRLSLQWVLDGSVPLCPWGTLVWFRRRGFCGHDSWQGQPSYKKQSCIHSPPQSKETESLPVDLPEKNPHECKQTSAVQSGPPEWGVLFDLIPAMCPEPHAHTDFTGITWGRCLHWGYSATQRGNPLRMPKVRIFPW